MFIVIDTFNRYFPAIVSTEDGLPKLFSTEELAAEEAAECQSAIVVEI